MTHSGAESLRAPAGMHDTLAPESRRWLALVDIFARRAARFGYGLVLTPVLEHLEVFKRVGDATEIVRKEMYVFTDKGGREMALRPEGTAPVVRAFVQHNPTVPWKAWYVAPHFRYERPQKGRYRQHHQVGVEVIGADDPDLDVEVIALAHGFYEDLGLRRVSLLLNSLGDERCRPSYLEALRAYLREHVEQLCEDSQARLEENPLRVLDCKRPGCVAVSEGAPHLIEHLCQECSRHFERVREGLTALGLAYEIAPRLVRGLDYYTRTTFEFTSGALDAAQNAIGGGGRYDGLVEQMGGPATPGIGFGIGIERVLISCDAEGALPTRAPLLDAYVVDTNAGTEAVRLLHELRAAGLSADRCYGGRSVKAQWRAAGKAGALYVVMMGQDEVERGSVAVKDMSTGEQVEVGRDRVVDWILNLVASGGPA